VKHSVYKLEGERGWICRSARPGDSGLTTRGKVRRDIERKSRNEGNDVSQNGKLGQHFFRFRQRNSGELENEGCGSDEL